MIAHIAASLAASLIATGAAAAEPDNADTLMSWWAGDFDNRAQITAQSGGPGRPAVFAPFFGLRGVHRIVEAPQIGPHVLFIAETKNDDPANVHGIRLQILTPQPGGGVRVSFAPIREPREFLRDATTMEPDLDKLNSITPADIVRFNPACDVEMTRTGERFIGAMALRGCKRGPELYFEYETWVAEAGYGFREQARRLSDDSVGWEQAPGSQFGEFRMQKR